MFLQPLPNVYLIWTFSDFKAYLYILIGSFSDAKAANQNIYKKALKSDKAQINVSYTAGNFRMSLTLKVPNKNCSRWHFNFLLSSVEENKAWFFMWILCLAEDSLETSSLIFSEKTMKKYYECLLLSSDWR